MSDQRICWSDVWTRTRRRLTNWTASTNAENYRRAHCRDRRATHAPSFERWSLIGHKQSYRNVADSGRSMAMSTQSDIQPDEWPVAAMPRAHGYNVWVLAVADVRRVPMQVAGVRDPPSSSDQMSRISSSASRCRGNVAHFRRAIFNRHVTTSYPAH